MRASANALVGANTDMKNERLVDDAAFNIDSMIDELLNRLDDFQADREVDLPEVEELAAPYPWVKAWMPS